MAIILNEESAEPCVAAMENAGKLLISAGTVAEAQIVAERRGVGEEMTALLDGIGFEIIALTAAAARRVAHAYSLWGKGVHPAALNFGDCFAYEVAKEHGCPLLYVGDDFSKTDLVRV